MKIYLLLAVSLASAGALAAESSSKNDLSHLRVLLRSEQSPEFLNQMIARTEACALVQAKSSAEKYECLTIWTDSQLAPAARLLRPTVALIAQAVLNETPIEETAPFDALLMQLEAK